MFVNKIVMEYTALLIKFEEKMIHIFALDNDNL